MYSILQPKRDVEIVNERFIHGSPLSAMLRTNAMFFTNGIWKFVKPNSAAITPAIAAIVLTIKRIISKVSSFVVWFFVCTVIIPRRRLVF